MNSGSGWNVRESVEFNLQRGDKDQVYKTVSWPLPPESPAGRSPAIPNPVLRLCFEIAGVMAFVQLI